ncbi:MAG: chalcone isomerase family protein [Polycyclovorans sp.]
MKTMALALFGLLLAAAPAAAETVVEGQRFPDQWRLDSGETLQLNGAGLRTYGMLRFKIYVAGLYLPSPSRDAEALLQIDAPRLLHMVFLRDGSQADTVKAWEVYLQKNCPAPCTIPEAAWQKFQSLLPETVSGESQTYLFTSEGLEVSRQGQSLGRIEDPEFARLILATWLGDEPTSPQLKAALLAAPASR